MNNNILSNNAGHLAVSQTKNWISQVIVGLNFCPFAKKELINNSIYYYVTDQQKLKKAQEEFVVQCQYLNDHPEIETSLVIFEQGFADFQRYLELVDYCNDLLFIEGYEGIFQIASFHPMYCFEGEDYDDAANFTNRSPYPTLHIIREESMEKVLSVYKNPEQIPVDNIELAREKGLHFFEKILKNL